MISKPINHKTLLFYSQQGRHYIYSQQGRHYIKFVFIRYQQVKFQ